MPSPNILIIGGGVVGLSVAREIKLRRPAAKVTLIEKEASPGEHASGRNSGVIHSGIYYSPDGLKARLTKEGNAALVAWCGEKEIPVRQCGKLIVARSEGEHAMLDELLRRGAANGVEVRDVSEGEARKIEPRAKTVGRALFVPSTASVDPRLVVAALAEECRALGVAIETGTRYLGRRDEAIRTSRGNRSAGFVVNCAGLYADRVARDFGFSSRYRVLPFKGLYLESDEPPGSLRCHVYPVPSKTNPFLGVHATVRPDGRWKIGPTAIPALWRENYSGFSGFDAGELLEVAVRQLSLLFGSGFDFRRLAWEEIRKQSRRKLVSLASQLVDLPSKPHPPAASPGGEGDMDERAGTPRPTWGGDDGEGFQRLRRWRWGTPGIRAQLVDLETKRLVEDFVLESDGRSLHVLNAVSPAFTCCLSFAKVVAERIQ